jgi:hypothetical protein
MLRIPLVLSVATVALSVAASIDCGHGKGGTVDANQNCQVQCFPSGMGSGSANCPFPTCATGSNLDQCPADCVPEPIA